MICLTLDIGCDVIECSAFFTPPYTHVPSLDGRTRPRSADARKLAVKAGWACGIPWKKVTFDGTVTKRRGTFDFCPKCRVKKGPS